MAQSLVPSYDDLSLTTALDRASAAGVIALPTRTA